MSHLRMIMQKRQEDTGDKKNQKILFKIDDINFEIIEEIVKVEEKIEETPKETVIETKPKSSIKKVTKLPKKE